MRLFLGLRVVSQVIGLRRYASLFAVLSASFSALYLVLLPTLPFGAFVLQAIMFITPVQVVFALVLGVLLALLVTLNVYARRLGGAYVGVAPAGSVLAGLVNAVVSSFKIERFICISVFEQFICAWAVGW